MGVGEYWIVGVGVGVGVMKVGRGRILSISIERWVCRVRIITTFSTTSTLQYNFFTRLGLGSWNAL